nr:uncharacterized protein LOC111418123 [Onthophagus taurus]XP_022906350.1 uncharacterized protein LOC111418123 [Onthophagus taurus]XP_022906351.1 uncharacterized protein LOC111418123 [Onthophagus taurus]
MESKTILLFYLLTTYISAEDTDWTTQCGRCRCKWADGKKYADCKNSNYQSIPEDLSSELRIIDFSQNKLHELKSREFSKANLSDVHKLKLTNCSIEDVNYKAFDGLTLLIELDLSNNEIRKLPYETFRTNLKLRILNLAHNRIERLEDNMFANMTHLQKVHLNNNKLKEIKSAVFGQTCPVQHIDLSNNEIKTIDDNFLNTFNRITSLTLEGNPWRCDCNLAQFRENATNKSLVTTYTRCEEPERLRGRLWTDKLIFACSPTILEPSAAALLEVTSINYTITCKVKGEPSPDIDWVTNGRIIDRDPRQNVQKYITTTSKSGNVVWNNLTIVNFNHRDRGDYKCVAKNPGGVDERNITLRHMSIYDGYDGGTVNIMPLIIGLSIGAVILLLLIFILTYCCCRKSGRDDNIMAKNRSLSQSNEFELSLDHTTEMGKALITEVNPVVKPPRQPQIPASVISGGTEVSETKKMLDEDSIYGDEDLRSADYDSRYNSKPPSHLSMDYRGEGHYPPDLLPFAHRTIPQVSPAGSSASTVPDTSRLPAYHAPQSPVHTPIYDVYRTLPYSRSHSPFTAPQAPPARVPRSGGYVTVPRRPRQSWSSEAPTSDIGEPLYDNLGLRTTATGSSVLSLNKLQDPTKTSTPNKANNTRQFPLSPIDPIAEHHETSPKMSQMSQTLPRSLSNHRTLQTPNVDTMRANWMRSPEPLPDSRRESTASLLPTPEGKTPKIPPRPPPKPKKRTSTGPLFEDEGEDGTEV